MLNNLENLSSSVCVESFSDGSRSSIVAITLCRSLSVLFTISALPSSPLGIFLFSRLPISFLAFALNSSSCFLNSTRFFLNSSNSVAKLSCVPSEFFVKLVSVLFN